MAKKPTILCIDDRVDNLRVRTQLLQQFGCDTIAVHDYQSALRVVSETPVDLLVIDYHLAGDETGEDIARSVRVMRPSIPLIMLTGDPNLPQSACQSVDAVLIKGNTNPGELLDLIGRLLPEAELRPRRPMLISPRGSKAS
jgi:CheY-like chemotaxis protein